MNNFKLIKMLDKRGFRKAASLLKQAGTPRALISPTGDVLNIGRGLFHGIEATKIWKQLDPERVRVDEEDNYMHYKGGSGSALYDLVEERGYISLGTAGGQELKASRETIKNPNSPAMDKARRLAKQWIMQFFEAEISELSPRVYYVAPFVKHGKFVRKDLKRGPLESFEELPADFKEEATAEERPEDYFDSPQAAAGGEESRPTSIRDLRKMLDKYDDVDTRFLRLRGNSKSRLKRLGALFRKRDFIKAAQYCEKMIKAGEDDEMDDAGWEYTSYSFNREHDADVFAEEAGERFSYASFDPDYTMVTVRYYPKKVSKDEIDKLAKEFGCLFLD